jgi:hypothetical protein
MKHFAIVVSLLAPLLAAAAIQPDWTERARVAHPCGNLSLSSRWDPLTGLQLRLTPTNNAGAVILDLSRQASSVRFEPDDAYDPILLAGAQFNPEALPAQPLAAAEVVVKFRQETWSVYLQNRPVAVLPAPFLPPAIVFQAADALPPKDRQATRFQKTDDFVFHDDFLVPEGEENELDAWDALSGEWDLHSVADDYTPPARRIVKGKANPKARAKAERRPMPGMSPNFYSLRGSGTNAVLLTGYDFYDAYDLEAAVQIGPGEGGLVFDHTGSGACHAFTAQPEEDSSKVRLSLWRTASSNATPRTELAAVVADITEGQWVMLKVRTFQNRIQCFVDKTKVIDIPAELPVGGRFGIFADADAPLRFDDVTARSNHDLDFLGVGDIRRHALVENGRFFPRRGFFGLFAPRETPFLTPPDSSDPQWLIVGAPSHGAHVFAAEFEPVDPRYEIGLIARYTGPGQPHLRFVCRRTADSETFRLESVGAAGATVLKAMRLPRPPAGANPAAPVTLMCDATAGSDLRCYRNGELALVHHFDAPVGGASGVFVGPNTRVRIANPEYSFARADLYTDQFEKNTFYVADHFMRHWSAPEGQWEDRTNNAVWYKGDVFGRVAVHLPLVDETAVHLGVPEGSSTGAWIVAVDSESISLAPGAHPGKPVAAAPTNWITGFVEPVTNRVAGYTIQAEGYWLWIVSGDKLLLQYALPEPLKGRRLCVTGFSTAQLAFSRVERYNVKDFLFKESLHEWTRNGGQWEIVNRFRCDPRWSHLNGEATNTIAALWSKYVFSGDFCVEFYAGTRHGWYARPGDYNLTVMNRDTTPSQGYTVTCTGWDPDLSQLYTKLYREGTVLAQSDAYCAPRTREGSRRKVHLPLVEAGRDVHGAWYYMKFRRSGTKLTYTFDNDAVFACDDPNPLGPGSLGIWTFMNSIMVARVKIAAESVTPRPVAFTPVSAIGALAATGPAKPAAASSGHPAHAAPPATGMSPEAWEADDPISEAQLAWHTPTDGTPYFTATSLLGSGTLLVRSDLPPIPYPAIAGWQFDVARTPRALFNFYYSVGRRNSEGGYVPERFYFHRLSGEDFAKGRYQPAGATEVRAAARSGAGWHTNAAWTSVTAWIPVAGWQWAQNDSNLLVKVEGLGNLQPGYIVEGLRGNGPGEGFAVRSLAALPYRRPTPLPTLACSWSRRQPDTVEIQASGSALDRAFACARVTLGSTEVSPRFTAPNQLEAVVPRDINAGPATTLTVRVAWGGQTSDFVLKWAEAPLRTPPMLLKLEGLTPLLETFESRTVSGQPPDSPRMRIDDFDPAQGSFLTVFNTEIGHRLNTHFSASLPLARQPVVQFRYRGGAMARISLACGPGDPVRLSEPGGPARSVRGAGGLILDNQWHTWWGWVTDAAGEQPYHAAALQCGGPRFGSVDGADQTGMYTELCLDDVVSSPTISRNEQLAFTPHYFDFEGVTQVQMALRGGQEDYSSLDATQRAAVVWRDIPNRQQTVPDVKDLGNGLARLFIRASSTRGVTSQVTDIPFVVDRVPPTIRCAFEPSAEAAHNGSVLRVTVDSGGGAPLDVKALKLKWNDTVVPVSQSLGSTFTHTPENDVLILNWPLIFREQLDRTVADEAFKIVPAGVRDGAGNAVADTECPRRIDYAGDRTPPTLLPTAYSSNIFWTTGWEVRSENRPYFTPQGAATANLVRKGNEAPYLAVSSSAATGAIYCAFTPKWSVDSYPYLAFRIRHPALTSNDNPCVRLVFEVEPTNFFSLALADVPPAVARQVPPAPLTWQSNLWESFTLDVGAFLAGKRTASSTGAVIKGLSFVSVGTATNLRQHVQSVYVFAPWNSNDVIRMNAFDESGIAGLNVESTQESTGLTVTPSATPGAAEGTGWMTLRVRDKAGNLSTPLYAPTCGRK